MQKVIPWYHPVVLNVMTAGLITMILLLPGVVLGVEYALMSGLFIVVLVGMGTGRRLDPRVQPGFREISRYSPSKLVFLVEHLARRAGLTQVPRVYIADLPVANAAALMSAMGPGIFVTPRLMELLDEDELEGVLAHEIMHIKNHDLYLLQLLGTLRLFYTSMPLAVASAVLLMPLLLVFLLPSLEVLFAMSVLGVLIVVLERGIMRLREYGADAGAAEILENPEALARALLRLEQPVRRIRWFGVQLEVPDRTVPRDETPGLLRSHPPTARRVVYLMQRTDQQSRRV